MKRLILILALVVLPVAPATAVSRHHATKPRSHSLRWCRQHPRHLTLCPHNRRRPIAHTIIAKPIPGTPFVSRPADRPPAQLPLPSTLAVGDVPGCADHDGDPVHYLQAAGASVFRATVTINHGANGEARACIDRALAAGYKVLLVVSYPNEWTPEQTLDFFRQVIPHYRDAWAIAIGGEQDLRNDYAGRAGSAAETGADYSAEWRLIAPYVRTIAPRALLVAGSISPWGLSWLEDALRAGLPGMQALDVHAYDSNFAFRQLDAVNLAKLMGVPLWEDEGWDGGGKVPAWAGAATRPLERMRGAQLAGVWLG